MRRNVIRILAATAFSGLFAGSAFAVNDVSFVASTGSDSNPCTKAQPCLTFQQAHDQTNANGSIYALDVVVDTTPLVVTKGMSIYSATGDAALRSFFIAASGSAVTVNLPANQQLSFINMGFDGVGTGDNGILFNSGSQLSIYGGVFRRFGAAAPNGFGIRFLPQAVSKLLVQEPNITGNGATSTGGGIQVTPQGASGGAQVLLNRVRSQGNAFGFAIDTTSSSNGVNALIDGGEFHFNRQDGIIIVGGAPIGLMVNNAASFANGGNGIRAIGANVTARVYSTAIAGNGTGVASVSGGAVVSYGNNPVNANAVDGTPATIPQK